jgi:predicted RNA binding protein YcfA (HicA-like mRNA interferase family)
MPDIPALRGRQLLSLLVADGWEVVRNAPHREMAQEKFPDGTRFTTVMDDRAVIPDGTLNQILSLKQTGLGKRGLRRLIDKHGL